MTIRLTLSSYLQRQWIVPTNEQLVLLNNPYFYSCYISCLIKPKQSVKFANRYLRRLGIKFSPSLTIPNQDSILFLGYEGASFNSLDCLKQVYNLIANMHQHRYRLIIGKGDYCFNSKKLYGFPQNLEYIIANNVTVEDKRVGYLPMGRDFRSASLFQEALPIARKEILCYCNFSLNTHLVRKQIYESIRHKEFITFEHMGKFLHYSISRADFFRRLISSKFAICPRGNGLDTFRMWDCLYSGTIPIVVKEAAFHRQLEDLPILFLDSPSEYAQLTAENLELRYNEMLRQEYNYSKLLLSTWLNQVNEPIQDTFAG